MKKQVLFFGAILGFSISLIGGYASGSQDCKNVLCLLKTPDGKLVETLTTQQDQALKQVWKKDPIPLKVSPLTLLKPVSSQELEQLEQQGIKLKTNENDKFYRGVTWVGDSLKTNSIMLLPGNIWVAPVEQVRDFLKTSKGSTTNQDISKEVKLHLRILQYLGLRLEDFNKKTHFVTIIAKKSDIRRPCLDPEIDDSVCTELKTQEARDTFMKDKDNQGLISKDYPWTGLGYTYDWGNPKTPGASEYVIKKGATVYVELVDTTCDFLKPKC